MANTSIILRILLVEDDAADVALMTKFLSQATQFQATLTMAHTVEEGLAKLTEVQYDCVLLDYSLADGTGADFLREAKRLHVRSPVIVVTGFEDHQAQSIATAEGASACLQKGLLTTDVLEKTILYTMTLYAKRVTNGSGPGVAPMMEQLVDLTRESVKAQTTFTAELKGLRVDFTVGIKSLQDLVQDSHDDLQDQVHSLTKFRWLLDWVAAHPVGAVLVVFLACVLAYMGVYVVGHVDAEQVQRLREAAEVPGLLPPPA